MKIWDSVYTYIQTKKNICVDANCFYFFWLFIWIATYFTDWNKYLQAFVCTVYGKSVVTKYQNFKKNLRSCSNIEWKSPNNTHLNIIELLFELLFFIWRSSNWKIWYINFRTLDFLSQEKISDRPALQNKELIQ